jgi:hypothetical protein
MSPAGISMFYGAGDADTAIAEVRPSEGEAVTLGTWFALTGFPFLDLVGLPDIPSIFDVTGWHVRPALRFLHQFAEEVARPAQPDLREVDYAPTQVFTEAVRKRLVWPTREPPGLRPVMAIRYRSALRPDGTCWVVFVGPEGCADLQPGQVAKADTVLGLDSSSAYRFEAESGSGTITE